MYSLSIMQSLSFVLFAKLDNQEILQIIVFTGMLLIAWFILRFIFRLVKYVFRIGCVLIFIIGLLLIIQRYFG